jgi:hypothetical protein
MAFTKTIPIFKKRPKKDMENYRSIANLCSVSKVFEKLILKRIMEIQDECNVGITDKQQTCSKKESALFIGIKDLIAYFISNRRG